MSRAVRVDLEGCWYHVVARGNERRPIFTSNEERIFYLRLLDQVTRLSGASFSAYSLVPNHVHLLIYRGRMSLASMIQRLHGNYAAHFNKHHHRKGHLFEGRYHAYLVTDDRYLAALIRYIHRNLPEAGLSKENRNWLWSSHRLYMNQKQKPWTQWRPAPGYEGIHGTRAYRELMGDIAETELPPVVPERPWAYGTSGSWKEYERRKRGRSGRKRLEQRGITSLDQIIRKIARRRNISIKLLKSTRRFRFITRVRSEAILECLAVGHGITDISRYFKICPSSVVTVVKRYGDPRQENKRKNVGLTPLTRPH
ncbi:transposase [bacterium]|nr:transposase [bacterium]